MSSLISPELQTRAFLKVLDPQPVQFCFRTLPDTRPSSIMPKNYHKAFKDALPELQRANDAGGGVFVVINEGGHTSKAIKRVRAVFADTDGAPVEPIIKALAPQIVVESSPGKYHVYWLVVDFPLSQFKLVQLAIARKFGTDPSVTDLSRVMRMPGFRHQKDAPFLSRLVRLNWQLQRYAIDELVAGLRLELQVPDAVDQWVTVKKNHDVDAPPIEDVERALAYLNPFVDRDLWVRNILALAHDYGECGRELAHRWSCGDLWNGGRHGT